MGGKYHVRVDGVGLLVGARGYAREVAGRVEGEWRRWRQSDWRRGDGQRVSPHPEVEAGRWYRGHGVEIGEAGRLSMGPALGVSYASVEDGFAALMPYGGDLYAVAESSGKVYRLDGDTATWGEDHDTGKAALRSVAVRFEEVLVGSGVDGAIFAKWIGGAGWYLFHTVVGAASIGAMAAYDVYSTVDQGMVGRLAVGACRTGEESGSMVLMTADPMEEVRLPVGEPEVTALGVLRGCLYVATWAPWRGVGRILRYDGRKAGGDLEEVCRLSGEYVAGWTQFDNLLFCGSGIGGRVWAFDGNRLVEAWDAGERGVTGTGGLRGLAACDGRLFVGCDRAGEGTALLSKLPAAVAVDRVAPVVGGTGAAELEACRLGWSTPSVLVAGGAVGALGVYRGELYLARDGTGAATIYRRDAAVLRNSGVCELSDFDGGDPGVEKLLRRLVVTHEALASGESVRVEYRLVGGAWVELGRSETVGSTSKTLEFAAGTRARVVGLRLGLWSGSSASGPVVTGVSLEYGAAVVAKRRWRLEARCEGVPGAMLRLLDGTSESRTGAELSGLLWAAREKEVVSFEDLDGAGYTVWFEGLEEGVAELAQERGVQTVAKCRFTEC